jgi:hypothetical protein
MSVYNLFHEVGTHNYLGLIFMYTWIHLLVCQLFHSFGLGTLTNYTKLLPTCLPYFSVKYMWCLSKMDGISYDLYSWFLHYPWHWLCWFYHKVVWRFFSLIADLEIDLHKFWSCYFGLNFKRCSSTLEMATQWSQFWKGEIRFLMYLQMCINSVQIARLLCIS